jgi:hypothetical protein
MKTNSAMISANWIDGCSRWLEGWESVGWTPYYINIMFHPLSGSSPTLIEKMKIGIIKGFYARFALGLRAILDPHPDSNKYLKCGSPQIARGRGKNG